MRQNVMIHITKFKIEKRKGGADDFNVDNALVCDFHFNPSNINISLGKSKKSLKHSIVPSFHEIKGRV